MSTYRSTYILTHCLTINRKLRIVSFTISILYNEKKRSYVGVMKLKHYQFSQKHSEMIVKAMVEGYQKYVDLRLALSKKMMISSAFAWTKENFIESEVAEASMRHGFTIKRSKAGPTWDYLQFSNAKNKSLFLIKNANYFNQPGFVNSKMSVPIRSRGDSPTYLQELAKINQGIEFSAIHKPNQENDFNQSNLMLSNAQESQINEQLELFRSEYDSFHILTYQLDSAQQMHQVMHYLPNPIKSIAYLIEDLSYYISGSELTEQEQKMLAPDPAEEYFEPEIFDLGTIE